MQWYYERDGQQVGPVSQAELVRLVIHRDIKPQTLVWHPAFGDEWRPASKAGLSLPSGDIKVFSLTLGRPKSPPTVVAGAGGKAGKVSSLWAWILLLPGLLNVLMLFAGQRLHAVVNSGSTLTGLCISAIFFLAFVQDRKALTLAGVAPPSFWWWLFIPGYFWRRWQVLRKGLLLVVCSVLLMAVEGTIIVMDPPPGFPHISFQAQTKQKPVSSGPQGGHVQAPPQEEDVRL